MYIRDGAGKSTLAKLISGIIKPTIGQAIVDGIDTCNKKQTTELRKKIGIVFQNPENQIIFSNVYDDLAFAIKNLKLDNEKIRIEIICSQAMGEDLLDGFKFRKIKCYTQIPSLVGTGYSVPKLGNEIWPQLNTMFIVYCNKEDSKKIKALIKTLRKQFVGEGLACYVSKAKEW